MKKTYQKWLIPALCLAMVLAMTACGGSGNASKTTGNAPGGAQSGDSGKSAGNGEKVKLLFAGTGFSNIINVPGHEDATQNVGDYLKAIANEFMAENPHVEVEVLVNNAASGTTETLDVEIASGNVPNLFFSKEADQSKYMGMGMIQTLDNYFTDEEVTDYIGGIMTNQNEWRMPMFSAPKLICINKTLFENADAAHLLPSPDDRNWTTDEYMNALRAVNNPSAGIFPTILFAKTASAQESMMGYLWPFGARMFSGSDLTKTTLNSPETAQGLAFVKSILDEGLAVNGPTALTDDDMWAMFENQTLAVAPELPAFDGMASSAGFEIYYVNYPHPADKGPGPLWQFTYALTVWKSENPAEVEASVALAKFMADKWAVPLSEVCGALPVRESQKAEANLTGELQAVVDLVGKVGTVGSGTASPAYPVLRDTFKDMNAFLFIGEKTPEEALVWFEETLNAALIR